MIRKTPSVFEGVFEDMMKKKNRQVMAILDFLQGYGERKINIIAGSVTISGIILMQVTFNGYYYVVR